MLLLTKGSLWSKEIVLKIVMNMNFENFPSMLKNEGKCRKY